MADTVSVLAGCRPSGPVLASGLLSVVLVAGCGSEPPPEVQVGKDAPRAASLTGIDDAGNRSNAENLIETGPGTDSVLGNRKVIRAAVSAGQLLDELDSLVWDAHTVTDPQATELLQRLRLHGDEAALAIRDCLLDGPERERVPAELRRALLNVLLSLDSPAVESVALELLASGLGPEEVLQLGGSLEWQHGGRNAEAIRLAAEQALIDTDPAASLPWEFFALLGIVGNEGTALLLSEVPPQHQAYATIALAALPDGSGLVTLEREARRFEMGRDTLQGRLAIQLLAQAAPGSPEAADTLIDLAEKGVIPDDVWSYVLDIVEGNWEWAFEPSTGEVVGSHTFYNSAGDQVIYRITRPIDLLDQELEDQRLDLLRRLWPLAPSSMRTGGGG